jgi:hypothetical protein
VVDPRQLGCLAADQRNTGSAADVGRTFDEVGHLLEIELTRGNVVEQDQRIGPTGDHVVDAVRRHVGTARA